MKYTIIILSFLVSSSLIAQTPCVNGMAGVYPCDKVDLQGQLSIASAGGTGDANDLWGWTDPLTGKEYALLGLFNGTSFIDVSDPVNPIYLGILPTQSFNSSWRDIKVINNHAFIGSEASNHGIQSFDLTTLRNLGSVPQTFTPLSVFTNIGLGRSHNVVALEDSEHLVVVGSRGTGGCSGGLIFIDVSDPANMVLDGCFSSDGYTHDAVCFTYRGPDTEHFGKRICIASNEDTQTIIDVTDTQNPIQISRTAYPLSRYTHQGWTTDDHKYLLFNDELDERNLQENTRTYAMDISDLDAPTIAQPYQSTFRAIDHNLYIKGQYAYQANYRAGFRLLDIRTLPSATFSELAFFDTYPPDDLASFNSAWNVYPYFKSGNIIVSDIEKGLFILKPTLPNFAISSPLPVQVASAGTDITFDVDLESISGYTDMVSLSTNVTIPGATITFGSTSIAPSGSTTMTISNTSMLDGAYSLVIQGRGPANNVIHDYSVSFKIVPRIFVDKDMSSSGDGSRWDASYKTLGEALADSPSTGVEIWIAEGTYLPTSTSNRNISFIIPNDVTIYGGFSGVEVNVADRDVNANQTILSGNLGDLGLASDNSYHVVQTTGSRSACVLDGLYIRGGNANATGNTMGGGLLSQNLSTVVRNCIFSDNMASSGSAIYNTSDRLTLENCEIIGLDAEMIVTEASKVLIQSDVEVKQN